MTATSAPLGAGAGTARSRRSSIAAAPWRRIDLSLIVALGSIAAIGLLMIYSSTHQELSSTGSDPYYAVKRQVLSLGIAAALMLATTLVDYRRWRDFAPVIYGGMCLALLAVVSPVGAKSQGHQAWFPLGSFQLQPSEFSKIALILCIAAFASWSGRGAGRDDERELSTARLIRLIALAGVPMALILLQPDLGTDLVFLAILFAMLVMAGARGRDLAALAVLGILSVVIVVHLGVLQPYQLHRLTAFLDPSGDARNIGYNLSESKIAIGSGGFAGRGLFKGSQTNLSYVPNQSTDFIFTAVGEQLGFVGCGFVLLLFGFVVWRIWRAAMLARDAAGTLICIGVMALIVFQVFENVGMTMGIMPIAGIPLPFMSYGGSALLAYSVGMGLVLNVHMRRFS